MNKQTPSPVSHCPSLTGCGNSQDSLDPHGLRGFSERCMALASDTPIPTLEGWMPINKIRPGQTVFDQSGRQRTVVAVCHRQPEPVFRVMFDDKSYLTAGAQQPWVTATHTLRHRAHRGRFPIGNWAWDFLPPDTERIQSSLIHQRGSLIEAMHSVPVARPLILPGRKLPIDPYLLGLWLGDGTSGGSIITCHEDDEPVYRKRASRAGENWRIMGDKNGVLSCSLARGPKPLFHTRLRQLEILHNKQVPPMYLRASKDQRLELLRGLMDSDGCVNHRGQAEFTSISEVLSRGVLELALTLGQKATRRKGDAKLYGIRISDKWRVNFAPTIYVFSLPRKAEVLKGPMERRGRVTLPRVVQRYIRSVEPAPMDSTICIVVDSPTRMFLAGEHMIPVRSAGLVGSSGHQ